MSDKMKGGAQIDRFVSHPGDNQKRKLPKRFYKQVTVRSHDDGFSIELDGRAIKTPGRDTLSVPTRTLAKAVAAEWDAQDPEINPEVMLLTKLANTALDRVAPRRDEVVEEISAFGASDLLCYRAEHPDGLVLRQAEAWDPVLLWLEKRVGAKLETVSGIMFKKQSEDDLARLRDYVAGLSDFELSGLHQIVTLTGSLVLGLAVINQHLDAETSHTLAHIDEIWQAERWGSDEEAEIRLNARKEALEAAAKYLELLNTATS